MDNRSKIMESALNLFAEKGYDAVGVQEIAKNANVTKPTLYHYFGKKTGLLNTLLEYYFKILYSSIENYVIYKGDITLSLTNLTEAYFNFINNYNTFYRMQLAMSFSAPESEPAKAVYRLNEIHYSLIEKLFLNAANDHGNMKNRQKTYASTFIGMINTYAGLAFNNHIDLNNELVYKAVHQFMHGIFS